MVKDFRSSYLAHLKDKEFTHDGGQILTIGWAVYEQVEVQLLYQSVVSPLFK